MITSSYDIKTAVSYLKKIITMKEIPILKTVKMFSNGSNVLEMTGTNLDEVITIKIPVMSNPQVIDFCVEIGFLKTIIETESNMIEFILDGNKLSVGKNSIQVESSEYFPTGRELGDGKKLPLAEDFLTMLPMFYAVRDDPDNRPVMGCVNICKEGCASTDGKQMICLPKALDIDYEVNMPLTALNKDLYKITSSFKIFAHEKMVRILTDKYDYRVKRNDSNYPKWYQILPNPYIKMSTVAINYKQLKKAIDFVQSVKEGNYKVLIQVSDKKMELKSQSAEVKIEVDVVTNGKTDYSLSFRPEHVILMLKHGFSTWNVDTENNYCPVTSDSTREDGLKYLVIQQR